MARIRTIKPEFPQSESIGKLSRDARLLYIQLWTIADDSGRARAASRMLASLLYPYDDDARDLIEGWLVELEDGEHIRRYEVDGSKYLEVVKWLEHQKIDKPSKSRLPEFVEDSRAVARPREASATDLGPSTLDLGPSIMDQGPNSAAKAASAPALVFKSDWPKDYREQFWQEYPKRVDKQAAFKKLEQIRRAGEVTWGTLIGGVQRYAGKVAGRDPTYTKGPAAWLTSGKWDDEDAPVFSVDDVCPPSIYRGVL